MFTLNEAHGLDPGSEKYCIDISINNRYLKDIISNFGQLHWFYDKTSNWTRECEYSSKTSPGGKKSFLYSFMYQKEYLFGIRIILIYYIDRTQKAGSYRCVSSKLYKDTETVSSVLSKERHFFHYN